MFALLRSSACCSIRQQAATTKTTTSIQLRLATRTDVPAIQRCNLACLPENYNSNFYCSHLRQWPDLALVAEEIHHPPPPSSERSESSTSSLSLSLSLSSSARRHFPGFSSASASVRPNEPKIVAYVLGKVETRPTLDYNDPTSTSTSRHSNNRAERLGHVTSLAVQKDFRRLGLARAMMTQLHYHLQHHGIASCGLHVRTSNLAACRLYRDDGYEVDQIIEGYYQDGEDAYFMKRNFRRETEENNANSNSNYNSNYNSNSNYNKFDPGLYRPGRLVKKAWKHGPAELRLPRIHVPTMQKELLQEENNHHHHHHHHHPSGNPPAQGHAPPSAELLSGI